MRTLVVHTGGIGDFLLACPAIAALAREGEVELAGQPDRLALAVAGGIAVKVHHLDAIDFGSLFTAPSPVLRRFAARFERAVVWMRDDGAIARGLCACGVYEVRCYPGLPPKEWAAHASNYYTECLGLPPQEPFRLAIAPEGGLDVVLQPGSGAPAKNWPMPNFRRLALCLEGRGREVTWCLGPAESPDPPGPRLLLRERLADLAADLAGAACYVGNDSGITHLAAAAGCRATALFGPTDSAVWAPQGPNVRVLQGTPWPTVEEVLEAIGTFDAG